MSQRTHFEVKSRNKEVIVVGGSFAPAGTGAPTAAKGNGFSVARTGVGQFTITLDAPYVDLIAAVPGVQLATPADTAAQFGTYTPSSTGGTIVLQVLTAGVAADIAANANNRLNFELKFRNTVNVTA